MLSNIETNVDTLISRGFLYTWLLYFQVSNYYNEMSSRRSICGDVDGHY